MPRMGGYVPADHKTRHQSGGRDEISLSGLTPATHASRHEDGGLDEISIAGLAGSPAQKAAALGLASLNASSKVVEQPASISDFLEASPTDGLATKAPDSNWAFDHNADGDAHVDTVAKAFLERQTQLGLIIDRGISCRSWTEAAVGSGGFASSDDHSIWLRTGATINSSILGRTSLNGYGPGQDVDVIDYDKALSFFFTIIRRIATDAQAVSRVQIKDADGIGALAEKGIGLQLDNLALTGEAYGTSRGTVDLATTLTLGDAYRIEIRLTSTGVEFLVDNVSKGSITTAGRFPTGVGALNARMVCSHANGAAGTNSDYIFIQPHIIQRRT